MTYYRWDSLADFDTWHAGVKVALGIPHPNENMATGEVAPEAQWTTSYTEPKVVGPNDVRAFVDDEVAAQHSVGLGVVSEIPPEPDPFA